MTTDEMQFSYFSSLTNTKPKQHTGTWGDLCYRIANKSPSASSKRDLPLIKLATFNGNRSNDNVHRVTGIEADYDGEALDPAEAAETLRAAGIEALIYTSPSHEDWAPRWRILCPLAEPLRMEEPLEKTRRSHLVGRLNTLFGGVLAAESFTLAQAFYIGSVENGSPVQTWRIEGAPIDQAPKLPPNATFPASYTPPSAPTGNLMDTIGEDRKPKTAEDIGALIDRMGIDGEKHAAVRDYAARCAAKGYSREDCEAIVRLHCPVWDRGVEKLIDTAYAKFYNPPAAPDTAPTARTDTEWTDPQDILGTMDPPEFPLDTLPAAMRNWVEVQARNSGNDPAGYAVAGLVVSAAALTDKVKLTMKRSGGWRTSARLWGALIGPPSARKSPVLAAATKPLHKIEDRYAEEYERAYSAWNAEDKIARGPQPVMRRVTLGDATPEAAQEVFKYSTDGLLMDRDELSGWLGQMEPTQGSSAVNPARAFWLTTYDGGAYSFSRVSRGSVRLKNASTCVLGGIQPEVLEKWKGNAPEDGLIQRFIPVLLRAPGKENHGYDPAAKPADAAYHKMVEDLHRAAETDLVFADDAQDRVSEILDYITALTGTDVINPAFASFVGKMPNVFGSLCVLFHVMDEGAQDVFEPQPITLAVVERAYRVVVEFILKMGYTFYFGVLDTTDKDTKDVAGYILTRPETDVLTTRLLTKNRKGRTVQEATAALDRLESLGWVMRSRDPSTRVPHWIINPSVHAQFKDYAAREKARRDNAVKKLAELSKKTA